MLEKTAESEKRMGLKSIRRVKETVSSFVSRENPGVINPIKRGAPTKRIRANSATQTNKVFKRLLTNFHASSCSSWNLREIMGKSTEFIPPIMSTAYRKSGTRNATKYASNSGPAPKWEARSLSLNNPKNALIKEERARRNAEIRSSFIDRFLYSILLFP